MLQTCAENAGEVGTRPGRLAHDQGGVFGIFLVVFLEASQLI